MKKVITILIIMCITLCACSKEEPKVSDTPNESEPQITEVPEEKIINTTCSVCGRITDCKEYIKTTYNLDLNDYLEKAFYLCDNCYDKVLVNEKECYNYSSILSAAQISMTYEDVMNYHKENGDGFITISPKGVSYENICDQMKKTLKDCLGDDFETQMTTSRINTIKITEWGGIVQKYKPENILEMLSN